MLKPYKEWDVYHLSTGAGFRNDPPYVCCVWRVTIVGHHVLGPLEAMTYSGIEKPLRLVVFSHALRKGDRILRVAAVRRFCHFFQG